MRITDSVSLDDRDITERFVRSAGPGGQNLRREATAVELRVHVGSSSLPPDVQRRLIARAARHVTRQGVLVVVSRAKRSQARNRLAAYARLTALVERAAKPPTPRVATEPKRAAREQRLSSKARRSAVKRVRRSGRDVEL